MTAARLVFAAAVVVDVATAQGLKCASSDDCAGHGTLANCCGGMCSTYWNTNACGPGKCAAGEVWNTPVPAASSER